jgi:hypothetical protein
MGRLRSIPGSLDQFALSLPTTGSKVLITALPDARITVSTPGDFHVLLGNVCFYIDGNVGLIADGTANWSRLHVAYRWGQGTPTSEEIDQVRTELETAMRGLPDSEPALRYFAENPPDAVKRAQLVAARVTLGMLDAAYARTEKARDEADVRLTGLAAEKATAQQIIDSITRELCEAL